MKGIMNWYGKAKPAYFSNDRNTGEIKGLYAVVPNFIKMLDIQK